MKAKTLKKQLENESKSAWEKPYDSKALETLSKGYIDFLSSNKTEREVVSWVKHLVGRKGFTENGGSNSFFITNRNKNIALVKIGKNDPRNGIKLLVAHVDSPRLDLKQNPLYEDTNLALFKTHYYGGIKKYQWVTRALALHGIVILENGRHVTITVGEDAKDPVFFISDLLPHLSHKAQDDKKMGEGITGEKLNLIIGSLPFNTDEELKDKVKLNIMQILRKKYKITESDFLSAELEVVPAGPAREVGFDRSMIAGYGQDDRICSYTALRAILDAEPTDDTVVVMLVDKEEIGSDGNTGAKSLFLKQVIKKVFLEKEGKADMVDIEDCLFNSHAISSDVNGAIDPDWKEVHEEKNAAKLGFGVCLTKFTGSRGKSGASDANAEYVARLRQVLNSNKVAWQTGELGKVDEGGGGTIAKYLAEYGMEVIDMGPALLSMHAPMELSSKIDVWSAYQAYKVFLEKF